MVIDAIHPAGMGGVWIRDYDRPQGHASLAAGVIGVPTAAFSSFILKELHVLIMIMRWERSALVVRPCLYACALGASEGDAWPIVATSYQELNAQRSLIIFINSGKSPKFAIDNIIFKTNCHSKIVSNYYYCQKWYSCIK